MKIHQYSNNSSQQDRVLVLNEYHYLGVQDRDFLGTIDNFNDWLVLVKAIYYVTKIKLI